MKIIYNNQEVPLKMYKVSRNEGIDKKKKEFLFLANNEIYSGNYLPKKKKKKGNGTKSVQMSKLVLHQHNHYKSL